MALAEWLAVGMALFLLGIFVMFLAILLEAGRASKEEGEERGRAEAGGVVIIGPVPIVFGTSQRIAKVILILALALTIFAILLFLMPLLVVKFA